MKIEERHKVRNIFDEQKKNRKTGKERKKERKKKKYETTLVPISYPDFETMHGNQSRVLENLERSDFILDLFSKKYLQFSLGFINK